MTYAAKTGAWPSDAAGGMARGTNSAAVLGPRWRPARPLPCQPRIETLGERKKTSETTPRVAGLDGAQTHGFLPAGSDGAAKCCARPGTKAGGRDRGAAAAGVAPGADSERGTNSRAVAAILVGPLFCEGGRRVGGGKKTVTFFFGQRCNNGSTYAVSKGGGAHTKYHELRGGASSTRWSDIVAEITACAVEAVAGGGKIPTRRTPGHFF